MTRSQRKLVEDTTKPAPADIPDTDVLLKRATYLVNEVERLTYNLHKQLDRERREEGGEPE